MPLGTSSICSKRSMANARVSRGRKTQELLAEWFRRHGWTNAQSRPASLPGTDVYGMPGLAPEVKATAGQDFTGALRQARANAKDGEMPFVVYRPKGYGPEKIGQWLVVFDLETATRLIQTIKDGF